MEQFRYVGNHTSTKLTHLGVKAKTAIERRQSEVDTFTRLYSDQLYKLLRTQGSRKQRSQYVAMSSQHGSFERLLEIIDHFHYEMVDVIPASCEADEFLCKVRVRIPTEPHYNAVLFSQGIPEGHKGYILVGFTIGVGKDFARLMKQNDLAEAGLKDVVEPESLDDHFNPDKVIPGVITQMRGEPRYLYEGFNERAKHARYYQTVEGFIYLVEIEGYATQAS
jgi:hypothetical protein